MGSSNMLEPLERQGRWRVPESETEVPGTLSFSPNLGILVRLNGALKPLEELFEVSQYDIVLGRTSDGEDVTLTRCLETASRIASAGYPVATYSASMLLIGRQFPSLNDIEFDTVWVSVHNIEECIGLTGIEEAHSFHLPREAGLVPYELRYRYPEQLVASLDGFQITTEFVCGIEGDKFHRALLKQRAYVKLECDAGRSLWDFLRGPFRSFHTLLELLADNSLPLVEVICSSRKNAETLPNGRTSHPEVRAYFQQSEALPLPRRKLIPELLFTLYGLGERFQTILSNWHRSRDRYGPTFEEYFGISAVTGVPLEHQFLSLVQSIESYHRRARCNCELPPEEFMRRREKVVESAPSDLRDWLTYKLRFGNEPPLKVRLSALYEEMPVNLQKAIGDKEGFVSSVADTRNWFAHRVARLESRAMRGQSLWTAVQQLKVMLKAVFLKELGLDSSEVDQIANDKPRAFYVGQ